jgi:NADH-quinone oxidoreductase subunit G
MRVVPRENEAINETWIADRDRYSCEGLYAQDRASKPMVKRDGVWAETDWQSALEAAAAGLKAAAQSPSAGGLGCLVSPGATLEELYLAARLTRGLGSENVDHRLRRRDFRDQAGDPGAPTLGCSIAELASAGAVLVVGSDLRSEAPLVAHRIRQAAVRHGAQVSLINPSHGELLFPVAAELLSNGYGMAQNLAAVLASALALQSRPVPAPLGPALEGIIAGPQHEQAARQLLGDGLRLVLLGGIAQRHVAYSELRALAAALAEATGARLGYLPEGGNAVGAALAGATPHRGVGGRPVAHPGLDAAQMLDRELAACLLVGGIESEDLALTPGARSALRAAGCVVALTPYAGEEQREIASVILPVAAFAETSGTWVNVEGRWQSVAGAATPPGEARPAWKVLRVLGNLLGLEGFEYLSSEDVRDELSRELGEFAVEPTPTHFVPGRLAALDSYSTVGIYRVDPVVRRSQPLQQTAQGRAGRGGAS